MKTRIAILVCFLLLIAVFVMFDLDQYLSLEYFRGKQSTITAWYAHNPFRFGLVYFLLYIVVTGLSLPGAAIMTVVSGAIFGLFWGTVISSFASSIGAVIAFSAARFLFHDFVQHRFSGKLDAINKGIEQDGAIYLFIMRLVPVFPFFIINILMALTPLRLLTFYLVSQAGMLAGTVVFVNAGTQLAQIESLNDLLSPALIASFILLGIFPLLAKKLALYIKHKKHLRAVPIEETPDYDDQTP